MCIFRERSCENEPPLLQAFDELAPCRLGLDERVRRSSVASLNRLVAHTLLLRDLYKKAHWQTSGLAFYGLHLLFDKHHGEQLALADALAERVQTLGGVALAASHDVIQESHIPRPPRGSERTGSQLLRLIEAHEIVLEDARPLARDAAECGDEGTNDLIVSQVVRTNELQSWFVIEHLRANSPGSASTAPRPLVMFVSADDGR